MGENFNVDLAQLRQHNTATTNRAGRAGTAAGAATHVARLDDAYGAICQAMLLPWFLRGTQESLAQTLAECADTFLFLAYEMEQVVSLYDNVNTDVALNMQRIMKDLDGHRGTR